MNCRPGDLAIVINNLLIDGIEILAAGKVVQVVRLTPANFGPAQGLVWEIAEPIRIAIKVGAATVTGEIEGIDDADLRPFRGGDITDAEVRELYDAPKLPEVA